MEKAPRQEKPKFRVIEGGKTDAEKNVADQISTESEVEREVRVMTEDPSSDEFIFNKTED